MKNNPDKAEDLQAELKITKRIMSEEVRTKNFPHIMPKTMDEDTKARVEGQE